MSKAEVAISTEELETLLNGGEVIVQVEEQELILEPGDELYQTLEKTKTVTGVQAFGTPSFEEGVERVRPVYYLDLYLVRRYEDHERRLGECPLGTEGCIYADCSGAFNHSCYGPNAPRHIDMGY